MPSEADPVLRFAKNVAAASRLPPLPRARRYRELAVECRTILADAGDAAIVEALATGSYEAVASDLGVGTSSINKAVTRHRRQANRPPPAS